MYLMKNLHVHIVADSRTRNFRTLQSNVFAKTKKFMKPFSPVPMGSRLNLLSQKNVRKSRDTVMRFLLHNLFLYKPFILATDWHAKVISNLIRFRGQILTKIRIFYSPVPMTPLSLTRRYQWHFEYFCTSASSPVGIELSYCIERG